MERGVYFDAWFPRQHCYHPSLPPRRLKMVEDLQEYGATVLVWSALGGGSISLPFLESEAWQKVPPRFRIHGFVNDAEFIQRCGEAGIDVFGIVFEVQGWEFPAELTEEEDQILAINELRGVGKRSWLGLREFSENAFPKLWPALENYFPGGLTNSDGEVVSNLLEEGVSRDIHGEPCHATWVECPDREHYCYLMDRNNPVWRDYLKAIIRIQIDAGVHGVQLDEADLPYFANHYGGCFCKDCMKLFRTYLMELPAGARPKELAGTDLSRFHYGRWLLERGYNFKVNQESTPLFWEYLRFQRTVVTRYFAELATYAREYAESRGRRVKVSGNFYHLQPHYFAFEPDVDVVVTEINKQRYKQPAWLRYAAGFAHDKPLIIVENPYDGVVLELNNKLRVGRGYDLFRMMQYEAAALGANMSIPYGAWMGSIIEDSFNPPHHLCVEIQDFLRKNESLFSTRTWSTTAIVFSVESTFQQQELLETQGTDALPFWRISQELIDEHQPYDVIMFPDGVLRADNLQWKSLAQYSNLVLPSVRYLTEHQRDILSCFIESGGHLIVVGEFALNLDETDRSALVDHANTVSVESGRFKTSLLSGGPQVVLDAEVDLALNIHAVDEDAVLHFIRYDYDEDHDCISTLPELVLRIRLPRQYEVATAVSPSAEFATTLVASGPEHRLELRNVPLYGAIRLQARP